MKKEEIIELIKLEREEQNKRWKDSEIQDFAKMNLLVTEEMGEAVQAYLAGNEEFLKRELIQVISLIFSYLEGIE